MKKEIKSKNHVYTVVIYAVFGNILSVSTFTNKVEANKYALNWANKNSNVGFDDVYEALEWFRENDKSMDYSFDLIENTIY